jgi:hypothetical protein
MIAFCDREEDWVLSIPEHVAAKELAELYARHAAWRRSPLMSEIAGHPNTPAETLADILAAFADSLQVASALATNPRASVAILEALRNSPFESAREHAEGNLRSRARDDA